MTLPDANGAPILARYPGLYLAYDGFKQLFEYLKRDNRATGNRNCSSPNRIICVCLAEQCVTGTMHANLLDLQNGKLFYFRFEFNAKY